MIHKKCVGCGEVGHKPDMLRIQHYFCLVVEWWHKDCYKKAEHLEDCPCGKGYIRK